MTFERVDLSDDVTLYRGDCLEVLPMLAAGSVDIVFTDPPYGHNNNNGDLIARWEAALGRGSYIPARDDRPIANDGVEANSLFRAVLPEVKRLLSPGCCCCCCCGGGGGPDPQFARWSLWLDEVLEFKQMVVWDKGPIGMGWHYRRSYETVLVAIKPGAAHRWYDDSRRIENIIRPGDYGIRKIIPSAEQHPTEKPVELPTHFIKLHTRPADLVLDPFMGSGTTGVAAVRLGRKFIGVEIGENYFEIAKRRISEALAQPPLFCLTPLQADAARPEQAEMFDLDAAQLKHGGWAAKVEKNDIPMTEKSEELRQFVLKYLDDLDIEGGSGSVLNLPSFELYAQDYLEFSEAELIAFQQEPSEKARISRLINCVAHLKRAMDCQLDTFLHVYNLYDIFNKRNLKIEKKLDFLRAIGIFTSRSLSRLNTIRNKMEHTYEVPKIDDIEIYYDLVSAFVAVLQRTILAIFWHDEVEMGIYDSDNNRIGFFGIKYVLEGPSVEVCWEIDEIRKTMVANITDFVEFAFFFKVWFLMYELHGFASSHYVAAQLSI